MSVLIGFPSSVLTPARASQREEAEFVAAVRFRMFAQNGVASQIGPHQFRYRNNPAK